MNFINKIKEECLSLQLGMDDKQINELIEISKEDLVYEFGFYTEDTLYRLSLCNVKINWCRFIRQYSNNPLNKILDVDCIISDEITKRETIFENMKQLVEKYEKLYFLDGIPEENKLELSQLYEDFTKFLINVDNCEENFQTLFIPITKKMYVEFKETDFIKIFELYSEWCVISKLENDEDIVKGFMEYYKSKH